MHTLEQLRSGALAGTRRLDLTCGLTRMPEEVFALADTLEVLNLSGNRLTELPHDMARLHKLKVVFASNNLFTHLPESLGDCPALEMVGFKATRIREVPSTSLPRALRWLILTDNAIEHLPDALGERPALQKLMLAGNRLQRLPEGLANAQQLELLRLSANAFTALPNWLTRLPRLAWLALAGNHLGWRGPELSPLPRVSWSSLMLGEVLGEGASGHIVRAWRHGPNPGSASALKLFKGEVTSDGLPEHEIAGSLAAGPHSNVCTPVAELEGHPRGTSGVLLPLIPAGHEPLAGPPSLSSCTRDVYAPGFALSAATALQLARQMAEALAHLHSRRVMHGDFYAHNILWNPGSGDAMLSDMGAATVLPADQPALCRALLSLELRAFGYLLEELLAHLAPQDTETGVRKALALLVAGCLQSNPADRPSAREAVDQLANL